MSALIGVVPHPHDRPAELIGCNYKKVDKIRKIRRDGTPEIQDAVRNDKMSINKAFGMIRKVELGTDETKTNSRAFMKGAKVVFSEENLGRLTELGGDLQAHANAAVEEYISRLHEQEIGARYVKGMTEG